MNCDEKVKFQTIRSAWLAADRLNDRLTLMVSLVAVYCCPRHDALHTGHIKRTRKSQFAGFLAGIKQRQP